MNPGVNNVIKLDQKGQDGEALYLQVSGTKYLIHAANNTSSPFVFSSLGEAQAFLRLIIEAAKNKE